MKFRLRIKWSEELQFKADVSTRNRWRILRRSLPADVRQRPDYVQYVQSLEDWLHQRVEMEIPFVEEHLGSSYMYDDRGIPAFLAIKLWSGSEILTWPEWKEPDPPVQH